MIGRSSYGTTLLRLIAIIVLIFFFTMHHASFALVLNNPYPAVDASKKIYYTSFAEQPKTLDPAVSYAGNESQFIGQIYEPALQYDYLIRPYTLIPLTATAMPEVRYYDKKGRLLTSSAGQDIAKSVYTLHIKPGILFQPHPALAKDRQGHYLYLNLPKGYLKHHHINRLSDFKRTGTRELTASDYIYQIKRLANPHVNSPIYGLMSDYIEGFASYGQTLPSKPGPAGFIDLSLYPLSGVRLVDRYTYEITLKGQYPQFMFWLAMSFFAPVPWEADQFYSQPGMAEKNLSFAWYPIGTGAFMLTENNPNSRMTMDKNPHYRATYFPTTGMAGDVDKGYLIHAGERLPLLDRVEFILEKETIPRWNKFLQGYYDLSGIAADSFDQAIAMTATGDMVLTKQMQNKGMHLQEVAEPAVYYMAFNMLDPVVGGDSERARKLRRAISIAVNYDENITIFFNGRGESAQGPIPPGIFGYQPGEQGMNPYVYRWDKTRQQRQRRSIDEARQLLIDAGYPGGIDPATNEALLLHYDVTSTGGPDEKAQLNWIIKELAAIGIDLDVRATQYNQFQDKMRNGNAQLFSWGWTADYPDPENFLFLFYGPNGKVKFGGENVTNYQNPLFDALFEQMKNRPNDAKRQALIDRMVEIIRYDNSWIGGINTKIPVLRQQWMSPIKPNGVAQNALKYASIDVGLRNQLRQQWNQAIIWPIVVFVVLLGTFLLPFIYVYKKRQQLPVKRMKK